MCLRSAAKFLVCVIIVSVCITQILSQEQCCWRDFTGKIPKDAFVAAQDKNGDNIHVGQAYMKDSGIIPVEIHPGVSEVHIPIGGHKPTVTKKGIKILCGDGDDFLWVPTNKTQLQLDLINKTPVIGGFEDAYGNYNIGRVSYGGDTKIGKVNSFLDGNAVMHFADGEKEIPVGIYEILIIKKLIFDIDVRGDSI